MKKSAAVGLLWILLVLLARLETKAQFPDPIEWNTGANAPVGSVDANWLVAYGDTMQATSAFVPAKVVGNCDGVWPNGSPPNADWITFDFGNGCYHVSYGCIDLYFRRQINLPATNACGIPVEESFCLDMDFWADNSVYQVSINGIVNFQYYNTLNPYNYNGIQKLESISLCEGWVAGANTLLVHTRSCPTVAGLLAQAKPQLNAPKHFLGKDLVVCGDKSVELSGTVDSTIWFDGSVSKTKTITVSGDYWAKMMDSEGCEIIDTISVRFPFESFVPNVFSPNDDGWNDCFSASFSDMNFDSFEFSIFDRWGGLVFHTNNPSDCWDGKYKGKSCAPGVYTYFIAIENGLCEPTVLKGDLTLIK